MCTTFASDGTMDMTRGKQHWAKEVTGTKSVNNTNIIFTLQLIDVMCITLISQSLSFVDVTFPHITELNFHKTR